MKQKIQKTIVLVLITLMAIPSVFFYKPQKAEAGFFDDVATWGIFTKEYILDPIAYAFINIMVSQMSKQAINWINDPNFLGPGGGYIPGFIIQPGVFLKNVGDAALGEYIKDVEPLVCSPFKVDVRLMLETKYKSIRGERDYCTLTEVGENVGKAYENFINDFDDGGWKQWVKITVNPNNNRYGSVVRADAEAKLTIGDKKLGVGADLARGFLDQKVENCLEKAEKMKKMDDGLYHWVDDAGRDLGPVTAGAEVPCAKSETITVTPGTFLQTQVSEAIGDSKGRLRIADEIDELIGTLLSKLIMIGFDELGLLGTDVAGTEDSKNLAKKQIKIIIDSITAKTQEYISIKKASLELTGKFKLDGTQLGTAGKVKQKINWNGNDSEWEVEKYYKEDRSSKINWDGKSFAWENDIYYKINPATGAVEEARCRTLEDTELPASSVTNNGVLSPFWNTSKCLDIKDASGKHFEYKWGTTTPTVKENSLVKAVSASCNSVSIGMRGYTIVTESDGFWSTSLCQEIGTTRAAYWINMAKTDKDIYREISTRYIERKTNWHGILFNWEDGGGAYSYTGGIGYTERDLEIFRTKQYTYASGDDFMKAREEILKIKAMATPPKICFPAERQANPQGQRVAGVIEGQKDGYERWTILECTKTPGDPASEKALKTFKDKDGDQEDYGAWKKLSENPLAKIKILLEGDIFDTLMENYGSVPIKNMFENLLKCFEKKYGSTNPNSAELAEIRTKIRERKTKRLQIIADILLAEKMIENAKTLENLSANIGVKDAFDYPTFLAQLNEIQKTVGISDAQISEAKDEKNKIEAENARVSEYYKMCPGGDTGDETEAAYLLGYNYKYPFGWTDGYNEYPNDRSGSLPRGDGTKKGYGNGEKDGYYDGYKTGYSRRDGEEE
ncbi:hypothetical protein KJ991_02015 [Patescibacteria group bacterium]|nr:hypothetical protein [Patescibacteria group bacterium]MBU4115575.1 hypothetical protein [Patescibacteria group bacterium]